MYYLDSIFINNLVKALKFFCLFLPCLSLLPYQSAFVLFIYFAVVAVRLNVSQQISKVNVVSENIFRPSRIFFFFILFIPITNKYTERSLQ